MQEAAIRTFTARENILAGEVEQVYRKIWNKMKTNKVHNIII